MEGFRYCRNCGKELAPGAQVCMGCGVPIGTGHSYCWRCGNKTDEEAVICVSCGAGLLPRSGTLRQRPAAQTGTKSKIGAGLFGIFLGWLGIHNFYLGFTEKAIVQLILGVLGLLIFSVTLWIAVIWGIVEGILILTGSISADAEGRPLAD